MSKRRILALALAWPISAAAAVRGRDAAVHGRHHVDRAARRACPLLSPDGTAGRLLRWGRTTRRRTASSRTCGWSPVAGGTPRRLTAHKATRRHARLQPGRHAARLRLQPRRRQGRRSSTCSPLDGGEPERLTDMPHGRGVARASCPTASASSFASHVIAGAESPEETKKSLEAREKNKVKARVTENRLFRFWDRWLTDDEYPHLFVRGPRDAQGHRPAARLAPALRPARAARPVRRLARRRDGRVRGATRPSRRTAMLNTDVFVVPVAGGAVRNLTRRQPRRRQRPGLEPRRQDASRTASQKKADGWPDHTRLARDRRRQRERHGADGGVRRQRRRLAVGARRAHDRLPRRGARPHEPLRRPRGRRRRRARCTAAGPSPASRSRPTGRSSSSVHDLNRPPELAVVTLDGGGFRYAHDARTTS